MPKAATQGSDGAIHHVDSEYQCRYNLRNGKGSLDEDLTLMTQPALSLLKPVFGGYPQMILDSDDPQNLKTIHVTSLSLA